VKCVKHSVLVTSSLILWSCLAVLGVSADQNDWLVETIITYCTSTTMLDLCSLSLPSMQDSMCVLLSPLERLQAVVDVSFVKSLLRLRVFLLRVL